MAEGGHDGAKKRSKPAPAKTKAWSIKKKTPDKYEQAAKDAGMSLGEFLQRGGPAKMATGKWKKPAPKPKDGGKPDVDDGGTPPPSGSASGGSVKDRKTAPQAIGTLMRATAREAAVKTRRKNYRGSPGNKGQNPVTGFLPAKDPNQAPNEAGWLPAPEPKPKAAVVKPVVKRKAAKKTQAKAKVVVQRPLRPGVNQTSTGKKVYGTRRSRGNSEK